MGVGAFCSNMAMFFIILTTALTLNRHGITHIETTRQGCRSPAARWPENLLRSCFTVGIVGVGFLAIPTLAGSTAYAFAETLHWKEGLDKKMHEARSVLCRDPCFNACRRGIELRPYQLLYVRSIGRPSSTACWRRFFSSES